MMTKWITSMEVFAPIILPILDLINPKIICEIGAAEGGNTKRLYDFLNARQGRLITIDPFPRGSFLQWVQQSSHVVTHIANYSLNAIPSVNSADVWFIDGDHNWFTVYNELSLIHNVMKKAQQPSLVYMHDIAWPCGRRDMYYDPSCIPGQFVQPNSNKLGVVQGKSELANGGLKGPYWALNEGGPRNGVLTAVEDFLQTASDQYFWINIPAILGLGVLVSVDHPYAKQIIDFYAPFNNHPLIALLEQDRVNQYLAVSELNERLLGLAADKCGS